MQPSDAHPWRSALRAYRDAPMLAMLALGFSSGLPLYLVFSTLSFWLREAGVSRESIGYFSWVALAYGVKWLWSPLVDRWRLPLFGRLGRLRGWLLLSQCVVVAGLIAMGGLDPSTELAMMAALAVVVAFASATQDIAVDAWRIEHGQHYPVEQLSTAYQLGYRVALIVASAGALKLAAWVERFGSLPAWQVTYLIMALLMGFGLLATLLIGETRVARPVEGMATGLRGGARVLAHLHGAVVAPLADFMRRYHYRALLILALICTYRISDMVMGSVANVFYVDMGFSKDQVADITKLFGLAVTILGTVLGGLLMGRFGLLPVLMLGALLSALSNLCFAALAVSGASTSGLIAVVVADNLSAGIASAAFVAYLSRLTNVTFSATQYALMSSLMALLPRFVGGYSGLLVDQWGWVSYFTGTALIGLPVLWLIWLAGRSLPEPAFTSGSESRSEG